jgi:hypothetical protein
MSATPPGSCLAPQSGLTCRLHCTMFMVLVPKCSYRLSDVLDSVAQWIRRWSTEPEILGSIPSGVAIPSFLVLPGSDLHIRPEF